MTGLLHVEYTAGRMPRRTTIVPCRVAGGSFLEVYLRLPVKGTWNMQRWLVHRAAKKMYSWGIRQLVPPQEPFAFWEILEQYHIYCISSRRLLWYLATPITLFFLKTTGRARRREVVLLQGERMQVEIIRIAEQLCQKVRNVALEVPDSKALEDRLRIRYGLPVFKGPSAFAQASLVLLFSASAKGETMVPGQGALFYFGEAEPKLCTKRHRLQKVSLGLRDGEPLPAIWEQTALITALWEMGCVTLDELEIIQLS